MQAVLRFDGDPAFCADEQLEIGVCMHANEGKLGFRPCKQSGNEQAERKIFDGNIVFMPDGQSNAFGQRCTSFVSVTIIYQPWAFTAVHDGQINLEPEASAYQAATDALTGWDPTYGSLYYYNPVTATSSWIFDRQPVVTIGKHIFAI